MAGSRIKGITVENKKCSREIFFVQPARNHEIICMI